MTIATLPQPFGFYRHILGNDYLHFGYWEQPSWDIRQAQEALSRLLLSQLPPAPAQVLDVGCGFGVTAEYLQHQGYEVTAIAPSAELIAYAQAQHPGPQYFACGFLDDFAAEGTQYDVILFQEVLQYFPDLTAVFSKAARLLRPEGRIICCDEVSFDAATQAKSSVHLAEHLAASYSAQGFAVTFHKALGKAVLPTCDFAVRQFEAERDNMLKLFGSQVAPELDHFLEGWRQQQQWYSSGQFGYDVWVLQQQNT